MSGLLAPTLMLNKLKVPATILATQLYVTACAKGNRCSVVKLKGGAWCMGSGAWGATGCTTKRKKPRIALVMVIVMVMVIG